MNIPQVNCELKIELIVDDSEVRELIDLVEEILKKEGLHNRSMLEGVLCLYQRLRQQRLHLLTLVEEKQSLRRENDQLRMVVESALAEIRINAEGKSISKFYEEFVQSGGIHYVR